MKELSIEQKAKVYNEALERAKGVIEQNPLMEYLKKGIEYIFPELKESEDEKIREKIIATIHLYYGEPLENEAKEMIAWLEKQDESKVSEPNWCHHKVDLNKEARHYLLHEHKSPLSAVFHQADLHSEMQYHKDIENAFKAGFELGLKAQKMQDEIKIGETKIYLEDDGGEPPYDGIQWLDLSCMEYEIPKDKFKDGDNVEIIIRKTQKGE